MSSFTTNSIVAFIISMLACVLFYYGFSALSELPVFENGADYYIEMLGINFHYQSISKGVIDTRDVVYFLSLIAFFLLVTRMRLSKESSTRKTKDSLRWISLLAGLFLLNFTAAWLHVRRDLTGEKRYSLTTTTKDLVRSFENDVLIDVFLNGELPSGFRKLSNTTQEFLSVLKETNTAHLQYRFISPDEDAGNGKTWGDSLRAAGVEPINLSVQVKAGEENKNIFPYALVHSSGQTDVVNLFPSSKRNISVEELNNAESMMEYGFARSLDKLKNPQRPAIAYATGNGEPTGANTFDLSQIVANAYDLNFFGIQ